MFSLLTLDVGSWTQVAQKTWVIYLQYDSDSDDFEPMLGGLKLERTRHLCLRFLYVHVMFSFPDPCFIFSLLLILFYRFIFHFFPAITSCWEDG